MNTMFQVLHFRKIKTEAGLKNVATHNMRVKVYDASGREIRNPQLTKFYDPKCAVYNDYERFSSTEVTARRKKAIWQCRRKPQTFSPKIW